MLSQRRTPQGGFTLIELVVVIVILGILAAFAIPRFVNIARDARVSALNGVSGTLRSTAALVHGMALARNVTNDTTGLIQLEGTNVDIANSYPAATATGIEVAMNNVQGFTITHAGGVSTFEVTGAPTPASCSVTYTQPASAGAAAVIGTPTTGGC